MGLFNFLKRRPPSGPYADPSINRLYELLFCDNLDLYRTGGEQPRAYPFDVLLADAPTPAQLLNQAGKLLIWETTTDATANELTNRLFASGREVVARIGPWTQPRRPHPARGIPRLTLLVSDGLYFGEGPTDVLFADPLAAATLGTATQLLHYLTETALAQQDEQAP